MARSIYRIVVCVLVGMAGFSKVTFGILSISFLSNTPFVSTGSQNTIAISKISNLPLVWPTDEENNSLYPDVASILDTIAPSTNIEFKLLGKMLNYPNPFSYSTGQTEVGYRLSKAAYLTFKVYTLTGQQVYARELTPSDYGKAQYNRLPFSRSLVGDWLAPGVYIYLLIYEGRVLAKNRMVLLP